MVLLFCRTLSTNSAQEKGLQPLSALQVQDSIQQDMIQNDLVYHGEEHEFHDLVYRGEKITIIQLSEAAPQ